MPIHQITSGVKPSAWMCYLDNFKQELFPSLQFLMPIHKLMHAVVNEALTNGRACFETCI